MREQRESPSRVVASFSVEFRGNTSSTPQVTFSFGIDDPSDTTCIESEILMENVPKMFLWKSGKLMRIFLL